MRVCCLDRSGRSSVEALTDNCDGVRTLLEGKLVSSAESVWTKGGRFPTEVSERFRAEARRDLSERWVGKWWSSYASAFAILERSCSSTDDVSRAEFSLLSSSSSRAAEPMMVTDILDRVRRGKVGKEVRESQGLRYAALLTYSKFPVAFSRNATSNGW